MPIINPPLKWAGGKRWLVPYLQPVWSKYQNNRLVEPFCGGLAVSLGLQPQEALLNDINPHLINFYLWLKQGLIPETNFEYTSATYYQYRDEFNRLILDHNEHSKTAAELFFYLNKTCFNGLCRFNKTGKFNVPFGRHSTINYNIDFLSYKEIFKNWSFTVGSYKDIELKSNDFIFSDPPYDVNFRNYTKDGFEWRDQIELTDWLCLHSGPMILCNQATDRIIKLYEDRGFFLIRMEEQIKIKAKGVRTPANVIIATKNLVIP